MLVQPQRRGAIVVLDEGLHELANQSLIEAALVEGLPELFRGGGKIGPTGRGIVGPDELACLATHLASPTVEPGAEFRAGALTMKSRSQRAARQSQGVLPTGIGDRLLKLRQIGRDDLRVEPDLLLSSRDNDLLPELAPQVVHCLTQGRACGSLVEVRPEESHYRVPPVESRRTLAGQIDQQGEPLLLGQSRKAVSAIGIDQFETAEQIQSIHGDRSDCSGTSRAAGTGSLSSAAWLAALALVLLGGCTVAPLPNQPGESGYTPVDLGGLLPCAESAASAISDDRRIVGWCETRGRTVAFEYELAAGIVTLPGLPRSVVNRAHGVNLSGVVVGESDGRAVRWRRGGRAAAIPGLSHGSRSVALAIDERGSISGLVWLTSGSDAEPFQWDSVNGTRIGTAPVLPGTGQLPRSPLQLQGVRVEIRDTNRAGSALVALELAGNAPAGALVRHDGTLWRLAPAGVADGVQPLDLSDTCEWVVGYTLTAAGHRRATWWRRSC